MYKILNQVDVEILADGVLETLEKIGFNCESDVILKAYEDAGAQVDYKTQVAKFPRKVIMDFVEKVKSEDKSLWQSQLQGENTDTMCSGFHPYEGLDTFKAPKTPFLYNSLSTFYYDDETGECRTGNKNDFIKLIKFGDSICPDQGVGHAMNLMDTAPEVEPLEAALLELEYSKRPRGVYVHDVKQIPYIEEIQDIFDIEDPHWHWMANICCNSPLKLDKVVCERVIYLAKSGIYPGKLAAMPVAGVNMPVTVAGSAVIVTSEFIAVWFAMRLLAGKDIPLSGMPIQGTMDMKSGNISFSAFDAVISRLTVCDFVKKWTGVQLAPGPGEWTPTKEPGLYCTLEKAYFAMTAAAFTGHHPGMGVGHIDAGLTISPVQFLFDLEFTESLKFLESPKITKELIGLDVIKEVGFGISENFTTSMHTIENMQSSSWIPNLINRNDCNMENQKKAVADAKKKVNELVDSYQKPEIDEAKMAKARAVLEKAKKQLIGK